MVKAIANIELKCDSVPISEFGNSSEIPMQTASGELNWNLLEGYLSPAFLNNLRQKVCRLEGKVRVGFTGEKSRIVASENSSDVYFVSFTGDAQFSCTCTTFKTLNIS